MTRFDSPGQVILLFAGALLASLLLIILLNAEARNRKINKEPEIKNGNLFSAMEHQLAKLVRLWRHRNHSGPGQHVILISESDLRASGRLKRSLTSLQTSNPAQLSLSYDSDSGENNNNYASEGKHPIRHPGKHRRKLDHHHHNHRSTTTQATVTAGAESERENATTPATHITRRRLDPHDTCYNTNEVLIIIAITCAVNFAFIFVVMALVHFCNHNNKVSAFPGLDSLVVTDTGDFLSPNDTDKMPLVLSSQPSPGKFRESTSYSSVQDYVNSLPNSSGPDGGGDMFASSMLSLHALNPLSLPSQEEPHTQRHGARKAHNLPAAFSMEDLLFAG